MEYYFNELSPVAFQRLINAILSLKYGSYIRLTPLRGSDGGRDAEIAPESFYFEVQVNADVPANEVSAPPRRGRYLFQVKHHKTSDTRITDARRTVLSDFEEELTKNILSRTGTDAVNYFYLLTNVPASEDSIAKVDKKRGQLLQNTSELHADVWWQEKITALLDQMPSIWLSFPELFAGRKVPLLSGVTAAQNSGLSLSLRLALEGQYRRDSNVKFLEIGFEKSLSGVFVDLDVDTFDFSDEERLIFRSIGRRRGSARYVLSDYDTVDELSEFMTDGQQWQPIKRQQLVSALAVLLDERLNCTRKILLEGGPGQGKSTITQMVAQIYRQNVLQKTNMLSEGRWKQPEKARLPFRIELRQFAEWLGSKADSSVEEYLSIVLKRDSGGSEISVQDIHNSVERSPIMFIFDGLDEVGSDVLRDQVIDKISEFVKRAEDDLHSDLKVVVTTRPPAIAGRRDKLVDFRRYTITPLANDRIREYVDRWLKIQLQEKHDTERVRTLFESRQKEPYVQALAKNPMQLAVLLNFIRLTSDAFPDRRAELYRDYFKIVIDRDVAKYEALRKRREIIEALHQFLGFRIHILTEAQQADGSIGREQLLSMVQLWLYTQSSDAGTADELFKLGEERLGLIVTLKGEGKNERYGFTIQPVREYFAAAFINEQYQGNAHDVFELMLRRAYWREVALFLAGLRRPNEKADLIIRSRMLDADKDLGWRQHGRAIISQLLQEGVFSQPTYILTEATDFALDKLDPVIVPVQVEADQTTKTLISILMKSKDEQHRKRLAVLLNKYNNAEDCYILQRIYAVVSRQPELENILFDFALQPDSDENAVINKRLVWPLQYGVKVEELICNDNYWTGASEAAWASALWRLAMLDSRVTVLRIPAKLQMYLIERMSVGMINDDPAYQARTMDSNVHGMSNLAAWVMLRLFQTIAVVGSIHEPSADRIRIIRERQSFLLEELQIDYTGIRSPDKVVVEEIIKSLLQVARSLLTSRDAVLNTSNDSILRLVDYLRVPGPLGWLVCRSISLIIRVWLLTEVGGVRRLTSEQMDLMLAYISQNRTLKDVVDKISVFYISGSVKSYGDFAREYIFGYRRGIELMPSYYRARLGGRLISVVDSIIKGVNDQTACPEWIRKIQLTAHMLRDIIGASKGHLEKTLDFLSKSDFLFYAYGPPLLTPDLQRIIKIARATNEASLLRSINLTLSTSKYIKIAGKELLLKFLRVSKSSRWSNASLFNKRYRLHGDVDNEEIEILDDVAKEILKSPNDFPFFIRCAAADYLVERSPLNLPPLLDSQDMQF